MLFEDLNHPGVVYEGTEEHMRGLDELGGYARKVDGIPTTPLPDGDAWVLRAAPEHWADEGREAMLRDKEEGL